MIAAGVFIMSVSMIPMNVDDGNFLSSTTTTGVGDDSGWGSTVCMSQVWLVSIGFTTVFAALFSKTWRINKICRSACRFQKVQVSMRDVLAPLAVLLTLNVFVLVTFTVLSPLHFIRLDHVGTDDWNRVISTYGTCQSNTRTWPYFSLLVLINASALLFALVQAYQARSIQSEFAESKYIAIVMLSFLQIFVIAAPLLFLVKTQPVALYVLKVGIVFLVSVVVLACIFVPKMRHVHGKPVGAPNAPRVSIHSSVNTSPSDKNGSNWMTQRNSSVVPKNSDVSMQMSDYGMKSPRARAKTLGTVGGEMTEQESRRAEQPVGRALSSRAVSFG
jgi:gamma-aminobutyric acid type B receptor